MFPKPARRIKGKRNIPNEQRARRKAEDVQYRRVTRPNFLMELARRQGRLSRSPEVIPGDDAREQLASLLAEERPRCEPGLSQTGCHGKRVATDVHHKRGRGRHLNDASTFLGTCPACHDYIETHRAWARERGYLLSRNQQP